MTPAPSPAPQRSWRRAVPAMVIAGVSATTLALSTPLVEAGSGEGAALQKETTGACPLPADQMRRWHGKTLQEKRRVAVREGVRQPDWRLQGCVNCHATYAVPGTAVSAEDPRHFCRTCHDRAAVANDCFSCHRSTPGSLLTAEQRE